MLRDVFYYGQKPNVHPREKFATDLQDAREQATTEHFWIINEFCDYRNFNWDFDFEFLPDEDVWAENHNNVWPSQHQKDSGTWLCPKEHSDIIIYRNDVDIVKRKNIKSSNWLILDKIDETKFDFSWHPDPTDPPYIYKWGCKFFPVELKSCVEYHTPNSVGIKYLDQIVELLPNEECLKEYVKVDRQKFDLSWRPDPMDPPYIYVWGNKYHPPEHKPTLLYHTPGATEKKYMGIVDLEPEYDRWQEHIAIDKAKFDFSWRPDPNLNEPPYIYVWGNKYVPGEIKPTLTYHVPGATEYKYMSDPVDILPNFKNWKILHDIDLSSFDFSWLPDPREPNLIYVWGNNHYPGTVMPTIEYHMPGATVRKYIDAVGPKLKSKPENFIVNEIIDLTKFDFSWVPDPTSPPYIYVWGNKYVSGELRSTIEYHVSGATEKKYMGNNVELLPELHRWVQHQRIDTTKFDLCWRSDPREPAYIYVWGNKHIPGELKATLEYHCPEATEKKYMGDIEVLPEYERWNVVQEVTNFDFTWRPDPREPAYIYVWGNKYVPGEIKSTLEYHTPDATEKKYMGNVDVLPEQNRWIEVQPIDKKTFDMSWRPDPREPAYIYVWGNKYVPGELLSTLEYHCEGATEKKYMGDVDVLPETDKWKVIQEVKDFDFTWRPDPREPAYIYVWGNKWIPGELKSTIEYHVPGATEKKYMGDVEVLPEHNKWKTYAEVENFDFTWRPDPREPAYIYVWGNKWIPGELKSTIEYHSIGATEKKYMGNVDVFPEHNKWIIYQRTNFDFTWRPDPREPAYIYVWGNRYIPAEIKPTIEYICPGATERKYMGDVDVLPELDKWKIHRPITNFDLAWRPDPREPAYIYTWGNKWVSAELMPTLEYYCEGATERKYMGDVDVLPENEKWVMHIPVDTKKFDMSWQPDPREPAYIYVWGNKYVAAELRPTLEYFVPGATEKKYMGEVPVLPLWKNYKIHSPVENFDFTWIPDPRDPPYIYTWGNKYIPAEIQPTIEFLVDGATERKYMGNVDVLPENDRWTVHQKIDTTKFDMSWRPDPREPAYIYVWGNKYVPGEIKPTLEYTSLGATEKKYMGNVEVLPQMDLWKIHQDIDKNKFDFAWRPDPREPAYIYTWGNKWVKAELLPTVEYVTPGATERKYMEDVEVLPELSKWREVQSIDKTKFDLSWRPDPREPAYIYVWGNKHIRPELKATLEYHCEGATEYKYIQDPIEVLPEYSKWKEIQKVVNFDFTWRPDPREPAYIYTWGNKWVDAELKPTLEYHCEGATERKYMGNVEVAPEYEKYNILIPIDKDSFDFTWRPDPREPAYIYVWGNQSNSAEIEPTVEYHCEGATERKYVNDKVAKTLPDIESWKILIPVEDFDFTWRPDPHSPPYIYVFGNQWNDAMTEPTIEYHVNGATDKKYITDKIAKVTKTQAHWKTLIPVDSFDYSWRPNPHSQPYIYVFGNQWHEGVIEPTIEYRQPGATDYKYVTDIKAVVKSTSTEKHWKILLPIDSFDYSWRPDPKSPPYIYVFGNKWNQGTIEPTVEYHCEGATDKKYMAEPVAIPTAQINLWSVSNSDDLETFDFTWRPNPHSPPQIYQWSDNGPRYTVPSATEVVLMERNNKSKKTSVSRYTITTTLEDLINEHPEEVFWALNPDLTYENFDFSWRPNEQNFRHINVFGNEYSKNTQTYYVNAPLYLMGYKELNYVEEHKVESNTNISMFYIDRGNPESSKRFEKLKELYPNIQKTRYFNNWVETINRCIRKSETKLFWILNSELDYTDFKFDFYPSPWQIKMIHVFGTQWSHWGNTYLINGETFAEDTKYVKIIEHLSTLNFVKSKKAKAVNCLYDVYLIDHGNYESIDVIYEISEKIGEKKLHTVEFSENYHKTFEKILSMLKGKKDQHIWICNSICHYDNFDFSYICDPFATDQLHVFPSDRQKYGDTFLVNVDMLRKAMDNITLLEEYDGINFNQHQTVSRISAPEFVTDETHVNCTQKSFRFPYAIFKTSDNKQLNVKDDESISLWSNSSKNILITSTGGTRVIVPKDAMKYIKHELYDYPYIKKSSKLQKSSPLDIIFLSNGESNADENYEHLLDVTKNIKNRIVRVDNIDGRVQAYHAAANTSNTPWFFTVFAKLKVNKDFDWDWQPDRLQISKHYIFHATNPVNDLEYGHQAMIAYNKKLALANQGTGLDFTLDDKHEVLEINSGVANFNTDAYSTWRTAFREVIKLCNDSDYMSQMRLHTWLTKAEGDFAEYALNGANDAYSYYEENKEDFSKLKLSYEWDWLSLFFEQKYKNKRD